MLPDEFVLWNAFPWHSFDPHRGLLSNRMPNKSEQLSGRPVLKAFLELFPCEQIVALGKIAGAQLEQLGVAHCVRTAPPPTIANRLCERRNLLERADDGGRRPPLQILSGIKPRRTSKPSVCPDGFSEPTATIVWGALLKIGVLPDEFVLWNAFPWHSFDPHRGLLSNRMPNKSEQLSGRPVLKAFLELFPCEQIVALGKIAAAQLEQLGVNAHCVRHPASGGAKLFRQQIAKIVR